MVFLFWNVIWKAGCQKGWEFFMHLISLPQFSSSGGRKKLIGDVVHTPHSKALFLQVSKFTCISVPGVACFKAFPLPCMSLASKDLGAEDFFCFLPLECGHWLQTPTVPCDFDFPSSSVFASMLSILL